MHYGKHWWVATIVLVVDVCQCTSYQQYGDAEAVLRLTHIGCAENMTQHV
jgi:hypothetical protein